MVMPLAVAMERFAAKQRLIGYHVCKRAWLQASRPRKSQDAATELERSLAKIIMIPYITIISGILFVFIPALAIPDDLRRIEGKVIECAAAEPLPGATVSVNGNKAVTDVRGDFKLQGLSVAKYTVAFELEGFESVRKSYDLTMEDALNSIVPMVGNLGRDFVYTSSGDRTISILVLDASTNQPIPFSLVIPPKKCTGNNGIVFLDCQPERDISIAFDVRVTGYSDYHRELVIPKNVTTIKLALKKLQ
jgi:hypothetical protein